MTRWMHGRGATLAAITFACMILLGCGSDDGIEQAMQDTGLPGDTASSGGSLAGLDPAPADTLRVQPAYVRVDTVSRPPRGTTARPRPAPPVQPDTGRKVVHGRVELALDEKTFAPADYLRVRLVGSAGSMETWTNRNGEFSFADVPPGTREIIFLTADKVGRVVYRQALDLGTQPVARLEVVHIPVDSVKRVRAMD